MTYFTTVQDANFEKLERPHLKIDWDFCACGSLQGYYEEFNPNSIKPDKVFACDECYLTCEDIQRK